MTQYSAVEDALVALTEKYGVDILGDTVRLVALLSDYAPNLAAAQRNVRAFARSGGLTAILAGLKSGASASTLIAAVCERAVNASDDAACRRETVATMKKLLAALSGRLPDAPAPEALLAEGLNYYRRPPKDQNIPVALLILEEAWEAGCVDALPFIANAYLKGKGVAQDVGKGMRYLALAADRGSEKAGLALAEYLWKGIYTEKDVPRAVALLKEQDDPNALFTLGEIYRENAEYEKAFSYYLEAAERKHVYAQYAAAVAYATGQGVKRDMREAKTWLRTAAALGHSEARKKLEELGEKWN